MDEGIWYAVLKVWKMILDSSMVEHSAVNRVVVGSSPTRGASGRGTGHYGGIRDGFFYSREGQIPRLSGANFAKEPEGSFRELRSCPVALQRGILLYWEGCLLFWTDYFDIYGDFTCSYQGLGVKCYSYNEYLYRKRGRKI